MGTRYHITLVSPKNNKTPSEEKLKQTVDVLLVEINRQMSTYISDSEISQFNQYENTDWFPVSENLAYVVSAAQSISQLTQGAFDITVAPLIDLWGFGAKTRLEMPSNKQIKNVLSSIGYQQLSVRRQPPALRKSNKHLRIDLSAIAKGFAVDKIADYLIKAGFSDMLVEIGGEVRNQGFNPKNEPWTIGIEKPGDKGQLVETLLMTSNTSMATSGDYRNYFIKDGVRYSHTINPATGKPVAHDLASVTVLAQSTMMADAYATALMVMGADMGKTFVRKNQIRVNMITRTNNAFQSWQNFDEIKIQKSAQKCKKRGGCIYQN